MTDRPLLLDLCCGAGGSARGYQRVGFAVVGVDLVDQPRYAGDRFLRGDALEVLRHGVPPGFVGVHASFPCQLFTDYRRKGHGVGDGYENLIPEGRELLEATGLPYVIENVEGARSELREPVRICGTSFPELDVQRHRLFEANFPLVGTDCDHSARQPRYPGATNRARLSRRTVEVGVYRMTLGELSESIPPAYTEHVGRQLMEHLDRLPSRA